MGLFEQIDAAQKGAFTRATGADDADHVPSLGRQGNTLEHFMTAIAFMQVLDFQFVHAFGSHKTVSQSLSRRPWRSGVRPATLASQKPGWA